MKDNEAQSQTTNPTPLQAVEPVAQCTVCGVRMLSIPARGMVHFYPPSWDRYAAPCMGKLELITEVESNDAG